MQGEASHAGVKARDLVAIDLALQGGGAHGAFTWGVLDRLLEEPWLRIDGISGTSAGAMNAAVLADGYADGGAEGARRRWSTSGAASRTPRALSPFRRGPLDVLLGRWTLDHSPLFIAMDLMPRVCSRPTTSTPAAPIRCATSWSRRIDFGRLASSPIKLFITATNVRTGRGASSATREITPTCCSPPPACRRLFQAVEIDGEAYWDGGYAGNPTITPLVRECTSSDTILVQINPVERPGTPRSARDILNRLNEVSFNAVLLKELRMIALLRQVAQPGRQRRRALGRHAHPPHRERGDGRARLLLQAQRRVGLPLHAARRRAPNRRAPSLTRMATISASAPRSTSMRS